MYKQTDVLRKENNQACKQLEKENDILYTDICVYIRSFSCSEYHQEVLRADILRMMLDGQQRGLSMQEVIGDDYQLFCDRVYAEMPRTGKRQQSLSMVGTICYCMSLLIVIWLVAGIFDHLLNKQALTWLPLTLGDVVSSILILISAFVFVQYICKHAFAKDDRKMMLAFALCTIVIIIINVTLTQVLFEVSMYVGLASAFLLYVLHKGLEKYEEE